jgi:FkbH-like protein
MLGPESETRHQEIEVYLRQQSWARAHEALATLWREQPTTATAQYLIARFAQLRDHWPLQPCRLAILRSFTLEPVVPLLRAAALLNGIDLTIRAGDFNAYAQELLDPHSWLSEFRPEIVILAAQTRDLAPDLWNDFAVLDQDQVQAAIGHLTESFSGWVTAFRAHCRASLIVHNLEAPEGPARGILDSQLALGQSTVIRQINEEWQRRASAEPGVYLLDYDGLVARHGRTRWHDERKWLTMRLPLAAESLLPLAEEWLRFIHPLCGRICKVLVTDLDQTLWGGVLGEDGIEGLQSGAEYPGAAFQELQRAMRDLTRRGILLAVCSKNDPVEAMEALARHPGLLLRPPDFAALRINWREKAENLREIAAELNVGLEALAFFDDHPVERARVRAELPEVTVIEVPPEPSDYARILRSSPFFERLTTVAEDLERGRYYAEQRARRESTQNFTTLEDFHRSLAQEVEVSLLTPATLPRLAQLTQKTNQFNLTTHRYTEAQLAELAARQDWRVYAARVKDRFGDYGIVGLAITRDRGPVRELESFLLSCRVINRGVETALLSVLGEQARRDGLEALEGWFWPTRKNAPAQDFYAKHGFAVVSERDGGTRWRLSLNDHQFACPDWMRVDFAESRETG